MKMHKNLLVVAMLFIIVFLVFFIRAKNFEFLSTLLSMTTFLFGIFITFYISDRHSRIEKIREHDSEERSGLESVYELSVVFGASFKKKILNTIDNYLMSTLDYKIWDYYKTEKDFKKINKNIIELDVPNNEKHSQSFKALLDQLSLVSTARKKVIALIDDKMDNFEWAVLLILAAIIAFSTIFINTGDSFFIFILIALDLSVILLLLLLGSLDNLSWKENIRIFEPYQKTFETIGKMRYYPDNLIIKKRVKEPKPPYRMATYPKLYPDMTGKRIKIIRVSKKRK